VKQKAKKLSQLPSPVNSRQLEKSPAGETGDFFSTIIFLLLPPLTGYRFGQPGNAGGQDLQFALDAHQQVRGYGYGKPDIAHRLQDRIQWHHSLLSWLAGGALPPAFILLTDYAAVRDVSLRAAESGTVPLSIWKQKNRPSASFASLLLGRVVEVVGGAIDDADVLLGHQIPARTGKNVAGDNQVHGRFDLGGGHVTSGVVQ